MMVLELHQNTLHSERIQEQRFERIGGIQQDLTFIGRVLSVYIGAFFRGCLWRKSLKASQYADYVSDAYTGVCTFDRWADPSPGPLMSRQNCLGPAGSNLNMLLQESDNRSTSFSYT